MRLNGHKTWIVVLGGIAGATVAVIMKAIPPELYVPALMAAYQLWGQRQNAETTERLHQQALAAPPPPKE